MSGNIWIALGVLATAFADFAIPYGFNLRSEESKERKVVQFRQRVAWVRLGSRQVPFAGTYFAGKNRHKGFPFIVEDITRLLELNPRGISG